jgi:hypothetical protein
MTNVRGGSRRKPNNVRELARCELEVAAIHASSRCGAEKRSAIVSFSRIWQPIIAGCVLGLFCCEPAIGQSSSVEIVGNAVFIKFQDARCSVSPAAINAFNVVTGGCSTKDGLLEGFVRDAFGRFTIFNVPGATSTTPTSINARGAIAGNCVIGGMPHGFVRAPDGTFTTFAVPTQANFYYHTSVSAINGAGVVTGTYYYPEGIVHIYGAYVLPPGGTFKSVGDGGDGAVAMDINEAGVVTGTSFFTNLGIGARGGGFVTTPDGPGTSFRPGFDLTLPFGINRSGVIAGIWSDPAGTHGFLRAPDGTITSYNYPGDITSYYGTVVHMPFCCRSASGVYGGINAGGSVAATYYESGKAHGFVRTPDGTITTFDLGSGSTYAVAINDFGIILGSYVDSSGSVGYLRVPKGVIAH